MTRNHTTNDVALLVFGGPPLLPVVPRTVADVGRLALALLDTSGAPA